ncbi:hypothetical protein CHL76_08690 [Marinococcus halophilus]|uniref:DUF1129 family protein n=1 Tax=Marinococcus halophilus TaxID=1371 RepID=A0A510Y4G1_MARHA|nr:hypothetical protein [Marinococcus halophilus]OZT80173.1 hypothetical protein CHL76_08690 [Marinococcus halophilus]GEK58225.1 hypothetical protein MHA01_11300 [Marinococcus halophilus]
MSTLVEENNEKRNQLNKENKKIYEDMMVYIRLSFNKSEQETEEVLLELLDHLLVLQAEGRDSLELFGSDPRKYAKDIVGELPQTVPKEMIKLFIMGICYFLSVYMLSTGLIQTILSYGFQQLEPMKSYSLGTTAIIIILGSFMLSVVGYSVFRYIKWSCFREVSKIKEFLVTGFIFGIVPGTVFFAMYYWLPAFGPTITFPVYWLGVAGVVFLLIGELLRRKA